MAIIFESSECEICHTALGKGELVCFPPFVGNAKDPIYFVNDACFHKACFEAHPLADYITQRYQAVRDSVKVRPPACYICNKRILDPDDYFSFSFLTEDKLFVLYKYNYLHVHESCLPKLEGLESCLAGLKSQIEDGSWSGIGIERAIKILETAVLAKARQSDGL